MNNVRFGTLGFSNNKSGLLPRLIRFFTKSKISHSFIVTGEVSGVLAVHEASEVCQIVPFDTHYPLNPNEEYVLFYPSSIELTKEDIRLALARCFNELAGQKYGYFQLLWFVWAWMKRKLGGDPSKEKNWFTNGVICSELCWYYLHYLGGEYAAIVSHLNPDTVQAQELLDIVVANKELFETL